MTHDEMRAIAEAAARKALAGFELARTDVVNPVNGARPYSYVTFAGARIEFQQLDHEIKYHNGSPVYDAATDKAAGQAQRINDLLFAVAKQAAAAALRAKPASEVVQLDEWPELAEFKPGAAYFPATDCLEYYEADETAITVDLPSGGASVQWNAERTKIIGVTIYGVSAALAQTPAIEAAALERADPRSFVAHAAGWETWRKLDATEQRTGQKFSREYRCMAVVQDAIRALGPAK